MTAQQIDIVKPTKLNIILDISSYDTFRSCERKYQYRYLMNKHPTDKASPLERGTLVHLAAESYYEDLKNSVAYQDAVDKALSAVRTAGVNTELDVDEILSVIDTMESYFDHWRVEDQRFEIVEVEKAFLYLLNETDEYRLYLSGKIDLIINDNNYTNLPIDHKSYNRSYPTGRMSNQFKNYCNALDSHYLIVNKIGFQKTLKPHEKFTRVPLSYDETYMLQWKTNVIQTIEHYIDCMANNYWPLNETSCDKFNRKCEYYDVCDSSGQQSIDYKLNALFVDGEPWDVTKGLKKTSEYVISLGEKEDGKES